MKKVLIYLISIFFLINLSFAFDITDSNNIITKYFSNSNYEVFLNTNQNLSNFTINYQLNSQNKSKIINLNNCSNLYCANFSLLDILNSSPTNIKFEIKLANESKNIFLDTTNPTFQFLNYLINSENKTLTINYNASDNYNILKIEVYKKEGQNSIFLKDITNLTSYLYNINKTENLSLEFKVYDLANNFISYSKMILIPDIFNPKINSYFLTLNENLKYFFKFNISDENLLKYDISQNLVSLSEIINGSNFNKQIQIPFLNGNILFEVIDNNSNEINKTINLNSPFNNVYNNVFSNSKTFKFSSNANNCILLNVDSTFVNENFKKQNNNFFIDLNIGQNRNYILKFSCSNSNFKQIFVKNFYHDVQKPSQTNLTATKLIDGNIRLEWNESTDNQSKIRYKLLRNGDVIYTGNRLDFIDSKVNYPNPYSYQLEVFDEATNFISTPKILIIPKKIIVDFVVTNLKNNLKVNKKDFSFSLNTDRNSIITLIQKVNNKEIFNKIVKNNNSNIVNFNLNLLKGKNEISIKVVDEFSNAKIQTYTINYEPKILSISKKVTTIKNPVKKNIISEKIKNSTLINNSEILKNNNSSSGINFWYWISFWIILLIIFIWIFIFNENKLKNRLKSFRNKKRYDVFHKKRKLDYKLDKSLEKIKLERAKKIEQINLNKKREEEKSKRVLSNLEKRKFEDLKNSRIPKKDILFSINQREKTKKRINKIKNKKSYNYFLKEETVEGFNNYFKRKINELTNFKKENKEEFNSYLNKKREEKSWSNSKDYLMSTKIEKDKFEEERRNSIEFKRSEKLKAEKEKEKEILKNLEAKEKHRLEKQKFKLEKQIAKDSFNDYLTKRTKKRKGFFAELDVSRDLFKRSKK